MIHIENCEEIFKQLLWKYKQTYDPCSKTPGYLLIVHIVVHWYKHDLCIVVRIIVYIARILGNKPCK